MNNDDIIYAIHKAVHTILVVLVLGLMFGIMLSLTAAHVYAGQADTPITHTIQYDGGTRK